MIGIIIAFSIGTIFGAGVMCCCGTCRQRSIKNKPILDEAVQKPKWR